MPQWDPQVYMQFASERTQPSVDLISRIKLADGGRIIDLGCGPGNSTALLRGRWPQASVEGLDSSADMLKEAAKAYPDGKWLLADIADWWAEEPYDLVFSNAALQWLPDHGNLFPRLFDQVAPGGALAVQMPAHYASPLRMVVNEAANQVEWRHLLEAAQRALTWESAEFYYRALRARSAQVELWETEYYHVVDSPEDVLKWFRGTGLRPFLEALETAEQRKRFEAYVLEGYRSAYPIQPDGRVLFPFRRLFMIAYRPPGVAGAR